MSVKINVTDEDIKYAGEILLNNDEAFYDDNNERIDFIKNFETSDLNAVPGSGKTTTLLAKLLIIEDRLPFNDGSGILVISHTNAAIDEIKNKLQKHCPNLFSYPNFIGTIQSFVNQFLAKPYYNWVKKKKITRISDDIYEEYIENYIRYNYISPWIMKKRDPIGFLKEITFNKKMQLIKGINNSHNDFNLSSDTPTYKEIKSIKLNLLKRGIISYDDAYFLANRYLNRFPEIKNIIRKRFSIVFVDEMQDMRSHQYEILEELFYHNEGGDNNILFQRIGDINQAIYEGGKIKTTDVWNPRVKNNITGSYRLSHENTEVVKFFAKEFQNIKSLAGKKNIKPHLIIYNDDNARCQVIHKFVQVIKDFQDEGKIPKKCEYPIKAISWITKEKEPSRFTLQDYCPLFNKEKEASKDKHDVLVDYILYVKRDFNEAYNKIIDAMLKILRLEGIKTKGKRTYTKNSLLKYLKYNKEEMYKKFKMRLYKWSLGIIRGEENSIIDDIRDYSYEFIKYFDGKIDNSKTFIKGDSNKKNDNNEEKNSYNCEKCYINQNEIDITSVHSVKGETHTATLYMESHFQKDGSGEKAKSYESQRLANQFKKNKLPQNPKKRTLKSAKVVYVGLSRATHLIAFAVHQENYKKYLNDIDEDSWVVNYV